MSFDTSTISQGPKAFAKQNGLTFEAEADDPLHFGGALFDFLQGSSTTNRYWGHGFEAATLTGEIGGSQTRRSGMWTVTTSLATTEHRTFGYMAIKLKRQLPQFVLDSTRNRSGIPMPIAGGQRLSLEGDFDEHFHLYCPKGYERDALYVFTPDLMALLIDDAGDFDVEIVDDWFFVYSTAPLDLTQAATWERLGTIRDIVGAKAITQTDLYADDRAGHPDEVTPAGRRLRMGFLNVAGNSGANKQMFIIFGVVFGFIIVVTGVVVFLAVFFPDL